MEAKNDFLKTVLEFRVFPVVFYFLLSFILLIGIILSKGVITGGDWTIPYTAEQNKLYLKDAISTWSEIPLIGAYKPEMQQIPRALFFNLFNFLEISGPLTSKISLLFVYTLAGTSMYYLLRYMGIKEIPSYIGGFIYITSPFFFNYTVMGWELVLFSMGILPIFFILFDRSIRERRLAFALICGILFSISLVQSTTIIWYSVALGALFFNYLKNRNYFKLYFLHTFVVYLILILTNIFWVYNLFTFKNPVIFGSENVFSTVSLGTWARVNFFNIIRGWGTLFNYSYETSYISILKFLPFILCVVVVFSLIYFKKFGGFNRFVLISIFIFPIFLYFLGPHKISKLPLSNIMRDGGRNIVLLTFVSVIAISYLIGHFYDENKNFYYISCLLLLLNAHPFFLGKLWSKSVEMSDIRVRTYDFPNDFVKIEKYIANQRSTGKVLYMPLKPRYEDYGDPNFFGAYKEFSPIFAGLSPKQGLVTLSDKEQYGSNKFFETLIDLLKTDFNQSTERILKVVDIEYFVFHFNGMDPSEWEIYNNTSNSDLFEDMTNDILGRKSDYAAIFKVKKPSPTINAKRSFIYTDSSDTFYDVVKYTNPDTILIYDEKTESSEKTYKVYYPKPIKIVRPELIDNRAMVWPEARVKPDETAMYRLNLKLENIKENSKKEKREKLDTLLAHGLKRLMELRTFPDANKKIVFEQIFNNYKEIKKELNELHTEKRENWYVLFLEKMVVYMKIVDMDLSRLGLKHMLPANYNATSVTPLLDDFKQWLNETSIACKGYCFIVEKGSVENMQITTENILSYDIYDVDYEAVIKLGLNSMPESKVRTHGLTPVATSYLGSEIVIYDLIPDNKKILNYGNYKNSLVLDLSKSDNNPHKILLNDLFTKTGVKIGFAKVIDVGSIQQDTWYKLNLTYGSTRTPIYLATYDIVQKISDDFVDGNKSQNVVSFPRLKNFKQLKSESIGPVSDLNDFTLYFKSDPMAKSTFMYVISNDFSEISDFNIEEIVEPRIYFTSKLPMALVTNPSVIFEKKNNTKYDVKISNAVETFALILNQRYNPFWKLTSEGKTLAVSHYSVNGYANGWVLDAESLNLSDEFELTIEFLPQRYSEIGFYIAAVIYTLSSVVILISYRKHHK